MDFKNDNLWLMHGDCLERMKEIPDGSVDMILTDPPYGMNLKPQRKTGKFHGEKIFNDDSLSWTGAFFTSALGFQVRILSVCFSAIIIVCQNSYHQQRRQDMK